MECRSTDKKQLKEHRPASSSSHISSLFDISTHVMLSFSTFISLTRGIASPSSQDNVWDDGVGGGTDDGRTKRVYLLIRG